MKTYSFLIGLSFLFTQTQALACGDGVYSSVPMKFSQISPELNALGYKIVPDPKYGWAFQDADGAQLFFSNAPDKSPEPCIRLEPKAEPYCGEKLKAFIAKAGKNSKVFLKDSAGNSVATLEMTPPPKASFIIKPASASGGTYLRLTANAENLDNKNYNSTFKVEGFKGFNPMGDITASRPMEDDSAGGLKDLRRLDRCLHLPGPEYNAMELQDHQTLTGNGFSEILNVKLGDKVLSGYRGLTSDGVGSAAK